MTETKHFIAIFYISGMSIPVENRAITAKNTCSALIAAAGLIATEKVFNKCRQVIVIEQEKLNCNNCQGGGCGVCGGNGYLLIDKK